MDALSNLLAHPEQLAAADDALAASLLPSLQLLYERTADTTARPQRGAAAPLKQLLVDGFDAEQVWQQIQLLNEALLPSLDQTLPKLATVTEDELQKIAAREAKSKKLAQEEDADGLDDSDAEIEEDGEEDLVGVDEEDGDEEDMYDEEEDDIADEKHADDDDMETGGSSAAEDDEGPRKVVSKKATAKPAKSSTVQGKKGRGSVVDDDFFKLDEMNAFLQQEDDREMLGDAAVTSRAKSKRRAAGADDDEEDDEEEGEEDAEEEEAEEEEEEAEPSAASGRKRGGAADNDGDNEEDGEEDDDEDVDFFAGGDDEVDAEDLADEQASAAARRQKKSVRKTAKAAAESEEDDVDEPEEEEIEEEEIEEEEIDLADATAEGGLDEWNAALAAGANEAENPAAEDPLADVDPAKLSRYEREQLRLKRQIQELEDKNVSDKPWQMTGEVMARKRPPNSLLAEGLTFDHVAAPAPEMTSERVLQIEDIIKKRIADDIFDDVQFKEKGTDKPFVAKRVVELDSSQHTEGLGEVLAQDYMKATGQGQPSKAEQEKEALRNEIAKLMFSLDNRLTALSNFHFTPKAAKEEIVIIKNTSAVTMEDVTPTTMAEGERLAPQDIRKPRAGELVGDKEADDTDRKRARRKKKIQKHVERVERERAELKAERQKKGTLLDGAADSRGSKDATEEKRAAMKKLEDSAKQGLANVTFVDKKAPRTKLSSSHVFSKLQSEQENGSASNSKKAAKKNRGDTSSARSAAAYKL